MKFGFFDDIDFGKARDWLNSLGKNTAKQAADHLADRAREHCPIDTGHLRSCIDVVPTGDKKKWQVIVICEYAEAVHEGHYAANQYGQTNTWVPGNPFMAYAVQDTTAAFPRIVTSSLYAAGDGQISTFVAR